MQDCTEVPTFLYSICLTTFHIVQPFKHTPLKTKPFLASVKKNFTMLCSKGVKSFLTTVKSFLTTVKFFFIYKKIFTVVKKSVIVVTVPTLQ